MTMEVKMKIIDLLSLAIILFHIIIITFHPASAFHPAQWVYTVLI